MSHAFVLGATATLAQPVCRLLAADGMALTLTGRNEAQLERLRMDLTARHRVPTEIVTVDLQAPFDVVVALTAAEDKLGPVTHFFSFPGYMGQGNPDDPAEVSAVALVNYSTPAQWIAACAARMHTRGHGSIVVISSVAGDRGRQSNYVYGAAKAALSTFTDGLRHRHHATLQILTVKPGMIASPMTQGMTSPLIAAPEKVASAIVRRMKKPGGGTLYVPFFWWPIMAAIRLLPEFLFNRVKL